MGGILALTQMPCWLGSTQKTANYLLNFHGLAAQATSYSLAAVAEVTS